MRATGNIRKIDEQGRFLIPMDIRKTVGLKNGDQLEIFLDRKNIVLCRYEPCENIDGKKLHKLVSSILKDSCKWAVFVSGDRLCTNDERYPEYAEDVDREWVREEFFADGYEVIIATDTEGDFTMVKEIVKVFIEE